MIAKFPRNNLNTNLIIMNDDVNDECTSSNINQIMAKPNTDMDVKTYIHIQANTLPSQLPHQHISTTNNKQ